MVRFSVVTDYGTQLMEDRGDRSLLEILRETGSSVYAPCGGRGTCGKCLVTVYGEGETLACTWFPKEGSVVILPGEEEASILVSQTGFLEDWPLAPNPLGYRSPAPTGIAIDIGTTTLVLYFVDLVSGVIRKIASLLNPQRVYGADVIARIRYCQEHEQGTSELQQSLTDAINRELDGFAARELPDRSCFEKVVLSGNTAMLHLFLGENPVSLATAPFTPRFTTSQLRSGRTSGLHVHPDAIVTTLPCLTAFVGADIVAGLAALKNPPPNFLFLDIGTNGEIALAAGHKVFTCATAAGPAFEGAGISCGMGAVSGAISSFSEPGSFRVIGHSLPAGICGSGLIDATAWMVTHRIVDETGFLEKPFDIAPPYGITITPQDIREVQLAKSAIAAGISVLLRHAGLTFDDLDALFLAGGFGNTISLRSAAAIGLIPPQLIPKTFPVGNSAVAGALLFLKNPAFESKINRILQQSEYLELSNRDDFTLEFAINMDFHPSPA